MLSEKARQLRNEYQRQYRRKNPDLIKKHNAAYWEKKADPVRFMVRKLRDKGLSQREIAEQLNISLGSVNAILNS